MTAIDVVVARQAIFDRDNQVLGYELLFRPIIDPGDWAPQLDGAMMTSTVIFSSVNIGIDRLVGDSLLFCNADRGLLTGDVPIVLPPARTVIEVLETVVPDAAVLAGCRRLVQAGYRLALDDFVWFDGAEQLLDLASIVKIDLRAVPRQDLAPLMQRCREFDVTLLAEKVETEEEYQNCRALGFELFQGYALSRPHNVRGRTVAARELGRIRTAARLLSADSEIEDLEAVVRTEPSLVYQLLHLASFGTQDGLRREVHTVREALLIVGSLRARSWLALVLMRQAGTMTQHQLESALRRARMVELLADRSDPENVALAFTAGMVSSFQFLLEQGPAEIAEGICLAPELYEAAFGGTSQIARLITDVSEYESGRLSVRVRSSGLGDDYLDAASVQAMDWIYEMTRGLEAA